MAEGESDDSQKTEDPTPKKIEESRRKGQVAMSRELGNWIMLLAGTIVIGTLSGSMLTDLAVLLRGYLEHAGELPGAPGGIGLVLSQGFFGVLKALAVPFAIFLLAAFIGPFAQVGPLFAPDIIKPDFSKVSPITGLGRLFSLRALVEFAKGLLKIGLISLVGVIILKPYFGGIDHMVGLPIPLMLTEMQSLVMRMMIGVLIALLILAIADVVYQRMEYMKRMRMTRQEMKDEYRQSEGDPQIKARLRQLRSERARKRMMQAVPTADVVITNPTHFAIALKYDPASMAAPVCVAKGMDAVALRIREIATESKVEIVENPPLARTLFDAVEVDQAIPQELYKAVAEIISFVFRKQGRLKPGYQ